MKYRFLFFNATAVLIVGWVVVEMPGVYEHGPSRARAAAGSVPALQPVDSERVQRLAAAEQALDSVSSLMADRLSPEKPELLAVAPAPPAILPDETPPAETRREPVKVPLPDRRLTVVLNGSRRVAMVDGELVGVGSSVVSGGTVIQIDAGGVLVRERDGREQALTLTLAQTRIGTLTKDGQSK